MGADGVVVKKIVVEGEKGRTLPHAIRGAVLLAVREVNKVDQETRSANMLTFNFSDIELSPTDFPRDLRGWVAYSIAYVGAVRSGDKEAALELLLYEADKIIQQVRTGKAPH